MHGTMTNPGIISLAVIDVFEHIKMVIDREFLLRVSFMEIYNEEIKDLLCPENCKLEIHENQERGVFVAGLKELIVNSPQQVLETLQFGEVNRHFGGTNMNANSSRSHAIFRMVIESKRKSIQSTTVVVDSDVVQVSTLHMVDLAGFERISKTGADGFRLREGTYINKSLVTLSNVIKKLSDGVGNQGGHIPYRDSKLTRILQSVLGGNAKMSIICNVSPGQAHVEETRGTLLFASRAKKVTTCAHVNEVMNDAALLKRQRKEIEELRKKLKGKLAEDMDKEVLKLRNELLKIELEREKLALQLEEEKKSQAEKERLIKEHEQTIENLSTMVLNCSSNINTSERAMQKACSLHPSEETITIRSDTACVLARFEDLLCGAENNCYQSTNEEIIPPNFVNVADDDTWIGLNNVTTIAEPAFFEFPRDEQYNFGTMETTSSSEAERTEMRLQKLLEENAQLKAQLAEERKITNIYNCFIIKILELQDGERRIRDILKETWMQLLRTQENEQNLRKENISLLLSKTRAEMLLDQIRGQLEFLEKILTQACSEHTEVHLYSIMVKDMVLTATKHARSIGDAYACLQLLHDDFSLEKIDSCMNFNEILDIGQEDMCNIADPDELVMNLSKKDSEMSHMHYQTDSTVNDLTLIDPSFDLVDLQSWGRHLTPEEREMAFNVFKRFCMKMGRAQLLEAKLAAAELHVVELKIEVDDLRARLQVLNVNSPSHGEIELQKLRSQCDCYKKEIELLMEQVPTAQQEAYKRNEIAKIQKENTKAQLRLRNLERQISHVKKWRKELRRLKEVDRERDTLLSRLEEALKRNRSLQQELVMLKEKTAYCSTTRRTTSKVQSAKKSLQAQDVAVLESHVFEAESVEVDDALWKQELDKEIGCAKLPSSSVRLQTRPPLKIIDVNREKSAKNSQPNYLNESVYNGITNKENILISKK
ncbi:kinesin-like protein KIN-7L isoform X2 [Cryptomeria japonica]|nr:kinesin-like protein KIN-7L isoform X2 [Cryptomeria japonica]